MIAGSDPQSSAEWYHAMNVAAAKLALACGVAPSEVRRVSGLHRVEVKRSAGSVRRQVTALARAAVLTAEPISEELVDGDSTVSSILSGLLPRGLGPQYAAVCERARRNERRQIYHDHTAQFQVEYDAISEEFFRLKAQLKQVDDDYGRAGRQLDAIAAMVSPSMSWHARRRHEKDVDQLVRLRDTHRALMAKTSGEVGKVMDEYRRHQAKRVYYHSREIPEYRNESLVFLPKSTLRRMVVCPFEESGVPDSTNRDECLQLMRSWNGFCEQFAVEKRAMLEENKQEAVRDHSLREMIARPAGAHASKMVPAIEVTD